MRNENPTCYANHSCHLYSIFISEKIHSLVFDMWNWDVLEILEHSLENFLSLLQKSSLNVFYFPFHSTSIKKYFQLARSTISAKNYTFSLILRILQFHSTIHRVESSSTQQRGKNTPSLNRTQASYLAERINFINHSQPISPFPVD